MWKNIYLKTLFALWEKYTPKKARWTLEAKVKRAETLIKNYKVAFIVKSLPLEPQNGG